MCPKRRSPLRRKEKNHASDGRRDAASGRCMPELPPRLPHDLFAALPGRGRAACRTAAHAAHARLRRDLPHLRVLHRARHRVPQTRARCAPRCARSARRAARSYDDMQECAEACRRCAEACRPLGGLAGGQEYAPPSRVLLKRPRTADHQLPRLARAGRSPPRRSTAGQAAGRRSGKPCDRAFRALEHASGRVWARLVLARRRLAGDLVVLRRGERAGQTLRDTRRSLRRRRPRSPRCIPGGSGWRSAAAKR